MRLDEIRQMQEQFVMPTYNQAEVAFERGVGAKLYDLNGKEYIDFGSGIGVSSVGYANQRLNDALMHQMQKILHISNLYTIPNQVILAKKIVTLSGYDMNVFFANSGAEANEGAIKLARKYGEISFEKKRYKIITLESSFHGRTLATLKATGQESYHRYFTPFPKGFVVAKNLQDVYAKIDEETCAVMIELIQGEGGIFVLPKEEVLALQSYLKERKILLIIDEVQSGTYRTGEFLASQTYGLSPDVITLAKGLGGGIPIGAVMSHQKEVFQAGDHGSTFGGNYLSTSAGLAVLEILSEEYASGALKHRIATFQNELDCLLESCEMFSRRVGVGLMLGLVAKDLQIQQDFIARALQKGVIVLRAGRNVVRFLPPLLISDEEIKEGFQRLKTIC